MKKTLLALAITALSANAFAVDLDNQANTPAQAYANEYIVPANGLQLTGVTVAVKTGVSVTTQSYLRFDLENGAKFSAAPAVQNILLNDNDTPLDTTDDTFITFMIASGGAGSNFVVFRPSANLDLNTQLNLVTGVTVTNKNAVPVAFNVYEDLFDAQNKVRSVYSKTGNAVQFKDALSVTAIDPSNARIAIGQAPSNFVAFTNLGAGEDADTAALASLTVSKTGALLADSSEADVSDLLTTYTWNLDGNLVASNGNLTLSNATGYTIGALANEKTATITATPATAIASTTVLYNVDGDTAIPETRLNASFQPTAASAFQVASKDFTPAGVIKRDGSSQQVDLVLNPQSVYENFVRITNKSGIAGKFVIEVINDAGESKSISLSEVAGQASDIINAGASTSQINAKDVYRAAEAKGLTLSAGSKLRFVVTGEVQSTQYEHARNVAGNIAAGEGTVSTTATTVVNTNDGISVQSYTVARDGSTFSTF